MTDLVITTLTNVTYNGNQYSFTDPHDAIVLSNQISSLNDQITNITTQLSNSQAELANLYVSLGALCTSANQIA